jgi:hypothetical protein
MDILEFIASLGWEEGELDRRIDKLDQELGGDGYCGIMLLTDEEYRQYMALQQPSPIQNITLEELC